MTVRSTESRIQTFNARCLTAISQCKSVLITQGPAPFLNKVGRAVGSLILGNSFYQQPIVSCIRSVAPGCPGFIDIGAATGTIVTSVASMFEQCVAVEPHPANVRSLRCAVQGRMNCLVIDQALSNMEGYADLNFQARGSDEGSLATQSHIVERIRVPVTTLDALVERIKVPRPILIKIDVQGLEMHVFQGGSATLKHTKAIISEFWPWGLRIAGNSATGYLGFMQEKGFAVRDLNGREVPKATLTRICRSGEFDRFIVEDLLFLRLDATAKP